MDIAAGTASSWRFFDVTGALHGELTPVLSENTPAILIFLCP